MGIDLVAGRDLLEENEADRQFGNVLINQTAARAFGWESDEEAIGEKLIFSGNNPNAPELTVIGVVKDFHLQSVHENVSPTVLSSTNVQGLFYSFIHIENDIKNTVGEVENAWNEAMPNYPFQYSFLDDNFDKLYKSEKVLETLLVYFATLAIFIACLGLYGLASYMIELRTKEIGIRKVLGSTIFSLVKLLSGEYLILVVISFAVSAPLAYFAMESWLETFEYRINISAVTFVIALVFAVLVSIITVSFQSIKTAMGNPVEAMRAD
jgi:putative ABC transport system permease protein